jgi:hypothetical protein
MTFSYLLKTVEFTKLNITMNFNWLFFWKEKCDKMWRFIIENSPEIEVDRSTCFLTHFYKICFHLTPHPFGFVHTVPVSPPLSPSVIPKLPGQRTVSKWRLNPLGIYKTNSLRFFIIILISKRLLFW